jgi:hypothetical protein
MEQKISLKDIEVMGEYCRLKKKNLRPADSKFMTALRHGKAQILPQHDYKVQPIIEGVNKYLNEMQTKLEEMFRTGGK